MAAALGARSVRSSAGVDDAQLRVAYSRFRRVRESGVYEVAAIEASTFELARTLGERYGESLGVRALDTLHVAVAMASGAVSFGTFDDRQGRLAEAVGMKLLR